MSKFWFFRSIFQILLIIIELIIDLKHQLMEKHQSRLRCFENEWIHRFVIDLIELDDIVSARKHRFQSKINGERWQDIHMDLEPTRTTNKKWNERFFNGRKSSSSPIQFDSLRASWWKRAGVLIPCPISSINTTTTILFADCFDSGVFFFLLLRCRPIYDWHVTIESITFWRQHHRQLPVIKPYR